MMKRLMVSVLLLALGLAGVAGAQQAADNPYVVFARAGRVNYVAGSVTRQSGDDAALSRTLAVRDNLEAGEVVRTGAYGRVEVLLNPGSYFRANAGTEFALLNTDLDDLRVRLNKGSVLLEVMGPDNLKMGLAIETPHTFVNIVKRGVYRLDVSAAGTNVIAQKGRALVGLSRAEVNGGKQLTVVNGTAALGKFDKKMLDGFDSWSRERSSTLAALNSRITDDSLRRALGNTSFNSIFSRVYGLWIFDRFCGCYTFLPFGNNGWGSPYGGSYGWGIDYNNFYGWWNPPGGGTTTGGGNPSGRNADGGRVGTVVNGPPGSGGADADGASGGRIRVPNPGGGSGGRDLETLPPVRNGGGKPLLVERGDSGGFGSGRDSSFDSGPSFTPSRNSDGGARGTVVTPPPPPSGGSSGRADTDGGGSGKKPNKR